MINFILLLFCGAFLGALGIMIVSSGKSIPGMLMFAVGLGVAVLGYCLRRRALSDPRPRLAVDSVGIFAPEVAGAVIPWSDITKVVFVRARSNKPPYLAIDVGDHELYKPTRSARMLASANQALGGGELVVQTSGLDAPIEQIRAAMQRANPALVVLDR